MLEAAADMSRSTEGVETLVVMLGSNNALGSVVKLAPAWTPADYTGMPPEQRLVAKKDFNVWRPTAFDADWELLVERLRKIDAQHVLVATVPSVTIAPIARGTDNKIRPDSRYFPYYTRPWVTDDDFDPKRDPHITSDEARAIDSAIDAYNGTIIASVAAARRDGLDWYLFDMGAVLNRLATRRYINSPWARPSWWTPYQLPPPLLALDPVPNTRFFRAGPEGRTDGGLFSSTASTPPPSPTASSHRRSSRSWSWQGSPLPAVTDSLVKGPSSSTSTGCCWPIRSSGPPASVTNTLSLLGRLDMHLDWVQRLLPFAPNPL